MCLYGRLPITPVDHLFKSYRSTFADAEVSLDNQLERLKTLEHLQKQSKLLIEQAHIKEKENYARWNLKHKPRSDPIQTGDLVIVQATGTIRGFRLHWDGPFTFDGWSGPPENRLAVIRNQETGKVWTRPQTEILKFTSKRDFFDTHILPLQELQGGTPAEPEPVNEFDTSHSIPSSSNVFTTRRIPTVDKESEEPDRQQRPIRQKRKPVRFRTNESPRSCPGRSARGEQSEPPEPTTPTAVKSRTCKSKPTFNVTRLDGYDSEIVLEWDSTWSNAQSVTGRERRKVLAVN